MSEMADNTADPARDRFLGLTAKTFVTLDESIGLSQQLGRRIRALPQSPDLAVGLANGGILPAHFAAEAAGLPYRIVKVRRKSSRLKQRLSFLKRFLRLSPRILALKPVNALSLWFDTRFNKVEESGGGLGIDVAGRNVVIVDDCIDSGSSVAHVRSKLLAAGARSVTLAAISWATKFDSQAMHGVTPDIHLHRIIHYYPWALNNPDYGKFEGWLQDAGYTLWK